MINESKLVNKTINRGDNGQKVNKIKTHPLKLSIKTLNIEYTIRKKNGKMTKIWVGGGRMDYTCYECKVAGEIINFRTLFNFLVKLISVM